jgi:hypothetical protein
MSKVVDFLNNRVFIAIVVGLFLWSIAGRFLRR